MTQIATPTNNLFISWAEQPALAAQVADFFCAHADVAYISHAELQEGRALTPQKWHPDLWKKIHAQALQTLQHPATDGSADAIACAWMDDQLVGIAFVSFSTEDVNNRFAVLDDMIVSPAMRGKGVGQQFMDWVAASAKTKGMQRIFLESGIANNGAHHFFERTGFKQTSVVMMRDL